MAEYRIIPRDTRDMLGEGPVWIGSRKRLFWVDIMGQRLWSLALADDRIESWLMPERIGWVVERSGTPDLLAGLKSGIVELSLDPVSIRPLHAPEPDRPHNRLNDAQVDAGGAPFAGALFEVDAGVVGGPVYRFGG